MELLYEEVLQGYAVFMDSNGGRLVVNCPRGGENILTLLNKGTSIAYLLTTNPPERDENDALFHAVTKIMTLQNEQLDAAQDGEVLAHNTIYRRCFLEDSQQEPLHVAKVRPQHMFRSYPDFWRIALATCELPLDSGSETVLKRKAEKIFDFEHLQIHAFVTSFLGKRKLQDCESGTNGLVCDYKVCMDQLFT